MMYPKVTKIEAIVAQAQYDVILSHLGDAIITMAQLRLDGEVQSTSPHAPCTFREEHMSRFGRLCTVRAELEEIVALIEDQINERVTSSGTSPGPAA